MKNQAISLILSFLTISCSIDLHDVNSVLEDNQQEAVMTIDVQVSGTMISTRSEASASELLVSDYDIYIFDVTTNSLQYYEKSIAAQEPEKVSGTSNYRIGSKQIVLATSGQKHIFVLGNVNSSVAFPELVRLDEATESNPATSLDDFRNGIIVTPDVQKAPDAPFVMAGTTFIASSANANVPVCLARTVAKISVQNRQPEQIIISDISVMGASASVVPFAGSISVDLPVIDYSDVVEPVAGANAGFFYLLPAVENKVAVTVQGSVSGSDFVSKTTIANIIYPDYDYKLILDSNNGNVFAELSPDFNGENIGVKPIQISGEWLSDANTVTLPFTPEPNYGFTINYVLNVSGEAEITKGNEDWYDAVIETGGTIRIRTLKENLNEDRTATFSINVGKETCTVNVIQQGLAGIGTVKFGDLEWMDRPIGATLKSTQAFATDIHSFGYFYQWGRNVPFPVTGDVETVTTQMTPDEALASHAFIAYTGESKDWNSLGIEGSFDKYWESVSPNPCPNGWRLPTYEELANVMPYRLNALIFANSKQNKDEVLPDEVKHSYVGYGSGSISENTETVFHSGIKYQGTGDAYYIRWLWVNNGGTLTNVPPTWSIANSTDTQNYMTGGENIFRIDRLKTNSSADFAAAADARNFWTDHLADSGVETLVFPCSGRREGSGRIVEAKNAAFYWSRSMFTGEGNEYSKTSTVYASGLLYFRPAGRFMMMYAPAIGSAEVYAFTEEFGYRNQAMPIRCVKEK